MTTTFLAPRVNQTFFIPGSNTPANGAQIFCYAAGTTTKTTVYKDNAALTSWTNPIVLDSGGNLPSQGELWQLTGTSMKYVFAPANDTDPPTSAYATFDNIAGINDVTSAASEWIVGPTPTFISTTSFSLIGDQTTTFQVGRRVKTTNTGGTVYSRITASAFTTLTTVTIANDASVLDTGLSAVSYGILSATNPSVPAIMTVSTITVSLIRVSSINISSLSVTSLTVSNIAIVSTLSVVNVTAGIVPLARMKRNEISNQNSGNVTISAGTSVTTIDLGTVNAGDRIFIGYQGQCTHGGTQGDFSLAAQKQSGTATVSTLDDQSFSGNAMFQISGTTNTISGFGIWKVTGAGTLVMVLSGSSSGSNGTLNANTGQLYGLVLNNG